MTREEREQQVENKLGGLGGEGKFNTKGLAKESAKRKNREISGRRKQIESGK